MKYKGQRSFKEELSPSFLWPFSHISLTMDISDMLLSSCSKYGWTSFVVKYYLDCHVPLGASERKRKTVPEFRMRKRRTETEGRYQSLQQGNCCCDCPDKAGRWKLAWAPGLRDKPERKQLWWRTYQHVLRTVECGPRPWAGSVPQYFQGSPQCLCSYFR